MRTEKLRLGSFTIYGLQDGLFYLDGGAMFGVVPKVLWQKRCPADEKNRIKLSLNCLLIQTEKELVLVDTGIGTKFNQKFSDIYKIEKTPGLLPSIRSLGFEAEDVSLVVNTHLHFDHCGGNTFENEKGVIAASFPKARYVIQKGEWEHAMNPGVRDRASYLQENFLPLERMERVWLVEGSREITKGVEVVLVSGHTASHQCVKVSSTGEVLFFLGDLVPTSAHVDLPYIMSYDLFPLETIEHKKKYYQKAMEESWIVAFNHDPVYFFGIIKKEDHKYRFQPLAEKK